MIAKEKRFTDRRSISIEAPVDSAFRAIENLGGNNGWYAWNWLWRMRGAIDRLIGGIGMRRSAMRRAALAVGDEVDFWRIESIVPGESLRLKAEMILPGEAWLDFDVSGDGTASTIRQTATFCARGWLGRAYWYAVSPFHELIFRGMLRGLARAALRDRRDPPPDTLP